MKAQKLHSTNRKPAINSTLILIRTVNTYTHNESESKTITYELAKVRK